MRSRVIIGKAINIHMHRSIDFVTSLASVEVDNVGKLFTALKIKG